MPTIPAVWSVTDKTFVQIRDAEPGHTAVASREVPRDDTGSVAVPTSVPTQEPLLTRLLWASWCFFPNPRLDCHPWEALRSWVSRASCFLKVLRLPLTCTLRCSPRPPLVKACDEPQKVC